MMKLAIAGKGGVGKTTICAFMASRWAAKGRKVIAVDADPFPTLALALGFKDTAGLMPIADMAELIEERTGAKPGKVGQFFKINPRVDDLPDRLSVEENGVRLLVMGGSKAGGAGCACPENTLVRSLLAHLILERDELVIVDTPAGVEHLTRGTAQAVDILLAVVEPAESSVQAARAVLALARDLGIPRQALVVNKRWDESEIERVTAAFKDVPLAGSFPFMREFRQAESAALLLDAHPQLRTAADALCRKVEDMVGEDNAGSRARRGRRKEGEARADGPRRGAS